MKKKLIVLSGPTAVGKTALSVALAKAVDGEIISADSMQVYRYMDIGTAKITKEEMQGVPHHLVDCLLPDEPFHVQRFQEMALLAMEGIYERGRIPILVGGTGFYIQSILYDVVFTEEATDAAYRQELSEYADAFGEEALHARLREVDPDSASVIHPNNRKRVIRALEFYEKNGYAISAHNEEQRKRTSPYQFAYFVLNQRREILYQRIEERVDAMLANGLLEEVKRLAALGYDRCPVAMQGLGYKEMLSYLRGECTLSEAVAKIKLETRHFAKRQLTWFRREPEVIWCDKEQFADTEALLAFLLKILEEKDIL